MNAPYSGAYSRRRTYSKAAVNDISGVSHKDLGSGSGNGNGLQIGTSDPIDNPGSFKTLSVKWDGSMGSVTGSGNFSTNGENFGLATASEGDTITLTAHPLRGYHFVKWAGGVSTSKNTNNPINIKMTTSVEVTAVFAKDADNPGGNGGGNGGSDPTLHVEIGGTINPSNIETPIGSNGGNGNSNGNGSGNGNGNNGTTTDTTDGGFMAKVKPFVKQWWWAILIVGYIVYKEWKGGKQ